MMKKTINPTAFTHTCDNGPSYDTKR